jgi:hypothetical protein
MATPNEEIAALKAEIAGYVAKLSSASSEDMIKVYGQLITARSQNLTELLEDRRAAAGIRS